VARRRTQAGGLVGLLAVVTAVFLFCRGSERVLPPADVDRSPQASASLSGPVKDPDPEPDGERPRREFVRVVRVVDGDTFHVLRGTGDVTVRLIGIDTPEVGWYGGDAECYGSAAGLFMRRLLDGGRVRLEFDAERIDPYGRTLAYGYLEDGRMVNLLLVRRGFAEVTIYEPNDRHEPQLRAAEAHARMDGRGLWSACR
jgi:micrococcal nuclease